MIKFLDLYKVNERFRGEMDAAAKRGIDRQGGGRLHGLDLFRIGLALLVFFFHSWCHLHCKYSMVTGFVSMGATAMTGFFLLSGFVMQEMYGSRDITSYCEYKNFILKRLSGLWPAYLFVGTIISIVHYSHWLREVVLLPVEFLGFATVFTSLFGVSHYGGTWFISCILFAYLLFPFASKLFGGMSVKTRSVMLLAMIGILLYSPLLVWQLHLSSIYTNPFFRVLEFMSGSVLASLSHERGVCETLERWGRKRLVVASLLIYLMSTEVAVRMGLFVLNWMMYSWIALPVFFVMILSLAGGKWIPPRLEGSVVYLSNISYAFFLSQFFCFRAIRHLPFVSEASSSFRLLVAFVVCVFISVVINEVIQKPSKRYLLSRIGECHNIQ